MFHGPVRVPENCGLGEGKLTLSFDAWKDVDVRPCRIKTTVLDADRDEPADDPIVDSILAHWRKRQSACKTAKYVYEGQWTVTKGAYSNDAATAEHLPEGTTGEVPAEDHESEFRVSLLLDFERRRVRRESRSEVFYLSGARFIPDSEVWMFDGKRYQRYSPVAANTTPTYRPGKNEAELRLLGEKPPMMFFRPIDAPILWSHGTVSTGETPVTPGQLMRPWRGSLFRYLRRETYDGRECVVLSRSDWVGRPMWVSELWVDTSRDCSIVRSVGKNGSQETGRLEVSYQHTPNGWYPESWTRTCFDREHRILQVFKAVMRTIQFDEEFGPEQFHVEPTLGMVVWDTTTDKRYIQGEPGQPNVEIGSATAEEQLASGGGRSYVGVALAGTSLVIVVVVGVAVWLRRR